MMEIKQQIIDKLGTAGWFIVFVFVGITLGILANFLIRKLASSLLYPFIRKSSPEYYKSSTAVVNVTGNIIQWTIILISVLYAISSLHIFIFEELIKGGIVFLPKLAVAIVIIFVGLIIAGIIADKISAWNFEGSIIAAKSFRIFFLIATVLSALEIIGIELNPFLYLFLAILFGAVMSVAIALGISLGLALKPEIENIIKNLKKKKSAK